jgi:predicted porin
MKRHLLTVAIAAATLLPLTAQAAPSVYGRLNLSVDYSDVDTGVAGVDGKVWELNSNSSRVGIRGNEKLNEEFTAVYKAEWGFDADMAGGLAARERYIGLKHFQWGAIRLGYIDSPFKNAEDDIDIFNDLANLDMQNFIYGQNRLSNSINYVSPKFLDVFGANISLQPGEKAGTGGCGPVTTGLVFDATQDDDRAVPVTVAGNECENHIADGISAAFSYEDDSLYLSFAMDKEITNWDAMRLNARYKLGDTTLSAMYQMAEPSHSTTNMEQEAVVLSGSYKMDSLVLRGQVMMISEGNNDTTVIGGGLDYNFTQNTKAFANIALSSKEKTASDTEDATYLGFGMETRF